MNTPPVTPRKTVERYYAIAEYVDFDRSTKYMVIAIDYYTSDGQVKKERPLNSFRTRGEAEAFRERKRGILHKN